MHSTASPEKAHLIIHCHMTLCSVPRVKKWRYVARVLYDYGVNLSSAAMSCAQKQHCS